MPNFEFFSSNVFQQFRQSTFSILRNPCLQYQNSGATQVFVITVFTGFSVCSVASL